MTQEAGAVREGYHIVIGFDSSVHAEGAVQEALAIAQRRSSTEFHVVVVAMTSGALLLLPGEPEPLSEEAARETVQTRIASIIEEYRTRSGRVAVEWVNVYLVVGHSPAETGRIITGIAKDVDADVIVVGSHGCRGVEGVLLGSVAENVVREAPTNVYIVRPAASAAALEEDFVEQPHAYECADTRAGAIARTMPVT